MLTLALFLPSSSISSLLLMSFSWALLSSFIIQGAGAMHVNTGIISTIVFNLILIIVFPHTHYCHRSRAKGGGQTRTYQDPCDSWPQGDACYFRYMVKTKILDDTLLHDIC